MFCEKCGKEISKYEVCGSEIITHTYHHHFDKKTGEEWYYIPYNYDDRLYCKKWDHRKIIICRSKSQIKKLVPTRRGNDRFLILKKHLKDRELIIGSCNMICCPHCGTLGPSQKGCFIATAVYGSYNAPEVIMFRSFRDDFLLKSYLGKLLVKCYYVFSPQVAKLIKQNEFIKKIIQIIVLNPILSIINRKT